MFDTSEDTEFGSTVVDARARSVEVSVLGTTLTISQQLEPDDLAPLFSDAWTGSCLWNCSVVLSEFIGKTLKKDATGKRIVELGAGCGLCSLYVSSIGAAQVVATDQATMVRISFLSRRLQPFISHATLLIFRTQITPHIFITGTVD